MLAAREKGTPGGGHRVARPALLDGSGSSRRHSAPPRHGAGPPAHSPRRCSTARRRARRRPSHRRRRRRGAPRRAAASGVVTGRGRDARGATPSSWRWPRGRAVAGRMRLPRPRPQWATSVASRARVPRPRRLFATMRSVSDERARWSGDLPAAGGRGLRVRHGRPAPAAGLGRTGRGERKTPARSWPAPAARVSTTLADAPDRPSPGLLTACDRRRRFLLIGRVPGCGGAYVASWHDRGDSHAPTVWRWPSSSPTARPRDRSARVRSPPPCSGAMTPRLVIGGAPRAGRPI